MTYEPRYTITPALLALVEDIASLRHRIQDATVQLPWIPALQQDTRTRNAHATTAIEGNPLTLPEVRALADGLEPATASRRSQREVTNYFAALRYIERHALRKRITDREVCELHRILARGVMDQGDEGSYRAIEVSVGAYMPPRAREIPALMSELLDWWNGPAAGLSPVLSSAIVHYRFEAIHPFGDVNGRVGRALALWELFRRGFDTSHIFSVDEYYWDDRPAYYAALARVHEGDEDLTTWLEYSAEGLRVTLGKVWLRIKTVAPPGAVRLNLRPKQEQLLGLLASEGSMAPSEIWDALRVSKQGAMDLINPLLEAGVIVKVGSKKTGRYRLSEPSDLGSGAAPQ